MISLDEFDPDALPAPTGATDNKHTTGLRGARRVEQIGVDACKRILDATFDNLSQAIPHSTCMLRDVFFGDRRFVKR